MKNEYSGYAYRRFRPPVKWYVITLTVLVVAVTAFTSNLIFGFVDLSSGIGGKSGKNITVSPVTFFTTQSQVFTDKSDAMATATEIRRNGGAGYLIQNSDGWVVVDNISNTQINGESVSHSSQKVLVNLIDESHRETISVLCGTFESTFVTLCDFVFQHSAGTMTRREIMDKSRIAYNNLLALVTTFETYRETSWNEDYQNLLRYLTNQLFALSLVWLDSGSSFGHTLKNASAWVAFALLDFSTN